MYVVTYVCSCVAWKHDIVFIYMLMSKKSLSCDLSFVVIFVKMTTEANIHG